MKTLSELITGASLLISEISDHPDYQALLDRGYSADLNIADASTALVYLSWVVDPPPAITVPEIPEVEVTHESRA
ncbi:MAG: hypothetical protein V7L22_29985 [Nostoc sp.]|uniref:hypothetical protein n=1 Tax=Nostoc sp. TaxID=1180 RepID=UPI002FF87F71